jgi:demethylmenaquinone methyltransferase/2-methoxy-6-polyprenyl-1,4-benzoquinol methylase
MNEGGPNRQAAIAKYRKAASSYDARARLYRRYGRMAVACLDLRPGDRVVDVACGTGANLQHLVKRVGAGGQVIGVDLSPDMLNVARDRSQRHGWANVVLVAAAIEEAELPVGLDAALFSLTHDVLQSKRAVENVVRHLRPGARVASFGAKQPKGIGRPLGMVVRRVADRYVTTFDGFDLPWLQLEAYVQNLTVRELLMGCGYLAWGSLPVESHTTLELSK